MKNLLTPAGIEPATFRFVAQHPNHCATAVPEARAAGENNLDKQTEIPEGVTVPHHDSGATEMLQRKLQWNNKFIAVCVLNNTRLM